MLEIVGHGVGKPRDSGVEFPAGGRNVFQSLPDREWLDEPVPFRMGKGLVDVVEGQFFLLLPVVVMDCLQTGDITQEGRSGQATEDDHRMPALEFLPKSEAASLGVEHANIGNEAAHLGHVFTTTSTSAPTVLTQNHRLQGTGHQQENGELELHYYYLSQGRTLWTSGVIPMASETRGAFHVNSSLGCEVPTANA